jgi:aminoglycoside phosphotransferase (APT) family kinase protein
MGELLARFRQLPTDELELDDLWADPARLVRRAAGWSSENDASDTPERAAIASLLHRVPTLFANRPVMLAHGDFAPVNVLTDGESLTRLLDRESVRLADPLLDVAWWAWAVSFASPSVPERAWPAFLQGAEIDAADPELSARVRSLQMLHMLELLVTSQACLPRFDASWLTAFGRCLAEVSAAPPLNRS